MRTGRRDWLWGVALGAVLLAGIFFAFTLLRSPTTRTYADVADVKCQSGEQLEYHIHSYLAIFVDGQPVIVPANVGLMPGQCLFWLHTHDERGIIHVESPEKRDFTLGQFFAVWGQTLSSMELLNNTGDATHQITATVNGQPYTGDPSGIVLTDLATIVLQYGPPFGMAAPNPLIATVAPTQAR